MVPYTVGATPQFRAAMDRLDPQARGDVFAAAMKVVDGHAAAHVHKLQDTGFVAFGVNRNALRVVCAREGGTLILLHVGPHDAAYEWARRHRTVQVGSVVRFVSVPVEEETPREATDHEDPPGPLAGVRDRVFARFGIQSHGARALRRAATEDELLELAEHMNRPVAEAILGLATDPDDIGALLRAYEQALAGTSEPDPPPLHDAVRASANASAIWLPRTAQALAAALEGRLEDWRIFLHPSQDRLVRKRTKGAFKVTGGPGTGKTVVALHRARFLAEEALADDPRPVLLTTFSRTLTEQLEARIAQLCDDDPDLLARIEVRSLVGVAREVLRRAERPHALVTDDVLSACWERALAADTLGWSRRDYEQERDEVLARSGAWTSTSYLTVTRSGRSTRLDRRGRRQVWTVLEAFEQALSGAGGGDAVALAREATRALLTEQLASPWSAVVCDEVQDASASELRLLAALARDPQEGRTRPDALFLCGDGYQRLYAAPVPLTRCGIEVRGRARRLRLNYRTTEGIRHAAIQVVRGLELDALEHVGEDEDSPLDGYRSLRGGPPPVVRSFDDEEDEATFLAAQAAEGPLLVLARTHAYRDRLADRLRAHGLPVHILEGRGEPAPEGVTLCTLHRCKGLEAPRVLIAGAHLVPGRFPGGGAAQRARFDRAERCLMYVGMTRARDWCAITRVGAAREVASTSS